MHAGDPPPAERARCNPSSTDGPAPPGSSDRIVLSLYASGASPDLRLRGIAIDPIGQIYLKPKRSYLQPTLEGRARSTIVL
jgi:hypothetical protein